MDEKDVDTDECRTSQSLDPSVPTLTMDGDDVISSSQSNVRTAQEEDELIIEDYDD